MGRLVTGDLVAGFFPFSEAQEFKRRPCVVLATWRSGPSTDVLVCMATTKNARDPFAIPFTQEDLAWGDLPHPGLIRPSYLFSANEDMFERKGHVQPSLLRTIHKAVIALVSEDPA